MPGFGVGSMRGHIQLHTQSDVKHFSEQRSTVKSALITKAFRFHICNRMLSAYCTITM